MPYETALQCGYYHPGHTPHWIQAIHSGGPNEDPPVDGRLLEVLVDGTLTVEIDGQQHRYWNHEPKRLAYLAACNDNAISVQWRWRLLRTAADAESRYVFSICEPEEATPCPSEPPTGTLVERMQQAGGFDLSVEDAEKLLGDAGADGSL